VQFVPFLKGLKQEQMEQILDRFDAREEVTEGKKIFNQGDLVSVKPKGIKVWNTQGSKLAEIIWSLSSLPHVQLQLDKMYVIKVGELKLIQDGQTVMDPNFIHEAGGFSYFGEQALQQPFKCPYTVVCSSETAQLLSLPKRQLDNFLGQDAGLDSVDAIIAALKKCQALQVGRGKVGMGYAVTLLPFRRS
jgi:cGMP-dependent protein kinase